MTESATEAVPPPSPGGAGDVVKGGKPEMPATSSFALRSLNATVENRPLPDDLTRSDVYVDVRVSLERERDKGCKRTADRAEKIKETVRERLSNWYTGEEGKARYVLKVYVVIASLGSPLNALTLGAVGGRTEECLEWFLQRADGSETIKAGRAGERDIRVLFGVDRDVTQRIPRQLVRGIVTALDIADNSAIMKVQS